jgi:hypothetical protein
VAPGKRADMPAGGPSGSAAYHGGVRTAARLRRRWPAVGAAAVLALVAASACSDPDTVTTERTASSSAAAEPSSTDTGRESALQAVLRARATAVLAHDRAGFVATLDDPASTFGRRQLSVFAALATLPLGSFDYGTPQPGPALPPQRRAALGGDAWVARVPAAYSLRGYDTGRRSYQAYFTVVRRGGLWRMADDRDGETQQQVWDLPGVHVVSDERVLVAGNVPDSTLRSYLRVGARAVDDVNAVWTPTWPGRLVLIAPRTESQARAQLAEDQGDLGQVAAVTDGSQSVTTGLAAADRIVVNPAAFARLRPAGRQVVISHESTHVAVRASAGGQVPTWLSEGFADYVGYRSTDLPRRVVAEALLDQVRAGDLPRSLPDAQDFDATRSTIAPSYNAAWLAVCLIADVWGQKRLVAFYRAATDRHRGSQRSTAQVGARLDRAFVEVLSTTRAAFTSRWRSYLTSLAR